MNDDSHPTTTETQIAPPPSHRRYWYIAATVVGCAIIAALVTSSRPNPLSPMETRLLGTWEHVNGDGHLASRVTYFPDRTSLEPIFPDTPDSLVIHYLWKIEDDRLIVSIVRSRWKDYYHDIRRLTIFSTQHHEIPIEFISDDELQFNGPTGPTFVRRNDE